VFYLGHGVDPYLAPAENQDRPNDVVFFGSSYDPVGWKSMWVKFAEPIQKAMEQAAENYLKDNYTPFWQVVDAALLEQGGQPDRETLHEIYMRALLYCHALDRVELIRAVNDARVDVYGGSVFRAPTEAKGWQYYLSDKSNVRIHPSIPLDEVVEVMKKSKICLNSMPYFKNGTHERLLIAAACGCLLITTDTVWTREQFTPDRDLILYSPNKWAEINAKINYYLTHEQERQEIAWRGREKVMQSHTWDHRVDEILQHIRT
jgi:glycosyltransferase involved in cell wall biosynthesis